MGTIRSSRSDAAHEPENRAGDALKRRSYSLEPETNVSIAVARVGRNWELLITSAVDEYFRDNLISVLMEDKDSWFWHDESYKFDIESPLAISRSLWDGLAQSEADSRSLFATTPSTEIIDSDHRVSAFSRRVGLGTDVDAGNCSYDANNSLQEGSPRSKRRRMLFIGATEESTVSDMPFDAVLDSSYGAQCPAMMPGFAMPSSPSPLWYLKQDDPRYTLNEALDPQKSIVEPFTDPPGNEPFDPTKLIVRDSDISGSCLDNQQPSSCESDSMDWPPTAFARSPTPGRRPSALHGRSKSSTPVAYPFALLKPCGAQGDVTLNDINQRISMPPSRPPSQPQLGGDDSRLSPAQSAMSSSSGGSPSSSGKSVVGLTKMHTEGNGTITIMWTGGG